MKVGTKREKMDKKVIISRKNRDIGKRDFRNFEENYAVCDFISCICHTRFQF